MSVSPYTLSSNHQPGVLRLLVVSREAAVLGPLWSAGEVNGWQLEGATCGWGAMERVQSGITPDLLVLDLPRSDKDALHFLRWLRRLRPELPIVALYDREDRATYQEAVRLGARDCLEKPLADQSLEEAIRRQTTRQLSEVGTLEGVEIASDDVSEVAGDRFFVAASPLMRKLRTQVELLAETDSPVLVLGESGSGKETTARLLHHLSVRSGFRFAKINCAALPSHLLETELFGSERNGDGPHQEKRGKLEFCDKGTLLLDEITEMPMALQFKLMQVLQSQRFTRPGSGTSVPVDVRILAASTTGLESAVSDDKLREDLCYRLSAYTVRVPPLRERREEIALLLHYFMRHLSRQYGLSPRPLSPAVLEACQSHTWPGNLRELESFVKRLLLAADQEMSFATDEDSESFEEYSSARPTGSVSAPQASPKDTGGPRAHSLKALVQTVKLEAEKTAIAAALERTGWNRKAASRLLNVSYRTLLYKIDQYQLRAPDSALVAGSPGAKPNGHGFGGNHGAQ
jgi:two-component system response regulator AtoC